MIPISLVTLTSKVSVSLIQPSTSTNKEYVPASDAAIGSMTRIFELLFKLVLLNSQV